MIQPPYGKPWLLYGLLGGSLALNILMVMEPDDREPSQPTPAADVAATDDAQPPAADASPDAAAPDAAAPDAVAAIDDAPDAQDDPITPAAPGEWQVVEAKVKHSLAHTFQDAIGGEHANALSAVYARLFMWDLDMRRDLQKGDKVRVAWRLDEEGRVEVLAASFRSRKFAKTLTAYRWTMPGDAFTSYWRSDGQETSSRLTNGPLRDYEQITSLLKDRPSHEGMDFKAPVGTPVRASKSGTVTRVNWNWAGNGNCVEVKFDDGYVAKYLHLSDLKVTAGAHVQPGQVLALTGNTGRSTAPHLHYQIERGDKIIDPIDYHGIERRQLPTGAMPGFLAEAERLSAMLLGS